MLSWPVRLAHGWFQVNKTVLQALALSLALSILGLAVVVWLVGGLQSLQQLTRLDPAYLSLAVLALYLSFSFAALRLQMITRLLGYRLKHRHALRAHILGMFGSAITPGGSGGGPAQAITLELQGMDRARAWAATLATISHDLTFYAWSLPVSLSILYASGLLPRSVFWTAGAVAVAAGTIVLAYLLLFRAHLLRDVAKFVLRGPLLRFRRRWLRFVDRFLAANRLLSGARVGDMLLLQLCSALGWFSIYAILIFILAGFRMSIPPLITIAGQNAIVIASAAFPTPGGSGFLELLLSWFLARQGGTGAVAAAVLVWRLLSYYSIFLLGPLVGGYFVVRAASRATQTDAQQA